MICFFRSTLMGAFKRNLFIYFVKLTFFTTAFKNNRSTKNRDLTQFNKKTSD